VSSAAMDEPLRNIFMAEAGRLGVTVEGMKEA